MMNILPLDSIPAFIGLIIGFGFIIFVHELGHFLVAKAVGIKCLQFSIGFGHAICAYRKGIGFCFGSTEPEYKQRLSMGTDPSSLGETEYRICWLPLGGYVKMLGQDDLNPTTSSQDPRSFTSKPIWARACVISAGVIMNIVFAIVFFITAFTFGVEFPPAMVGGVEQQMPAATTYATGYEGDPAYYGLQPGDQITHVDDDPITDFIEVAIHTALSARDETHTLTIKRLDTNEPLQFTMKPQPSRFTQLLSLGIRPPKGMNVIATREGDLLNIAGVKPDMTIKAVDNQDVRQYGQVHKLVTTARSRPVQVTFADEITGRSVQVDVRAEPGLMRIADQPKNLLGLVPAIRVANVDPGTPAERIGIKSADVIAAIDDVTWPHIVQLSQIVKRSEDRAMSITVLRDGGLIQLEPVKANRKQQIGIHMDHYLEESLVAMTLPGSPAAMLELTRGSIIHTVNGNQVKDWHDLQRILQDQASSAEAGASVAMGYKLNVKGQPLSMTTFKLDPPSITALRAALWLDPLQSWLNNLREPILANNPVDAMILGIEKTGQIMVQTYLTLTRLLQGTIRVSHLRGPVGIMHEGTRIAKQGWIYLIFFLGLISVNLAVINFLPIPIVDGGLMVFLIVEKLKGSPVSPRIHMAATVVGLALIASILLMTLFYDTARLIGSG